MTECIARNSEQLTELILGEVMNGRVVRSHAVEIRVIEGRLCPATFQL